LLKVSDNVGKVTAKDVSQKSRKESDDGSDDDGEDRGKWKTLEHHGVIFFPPY
jgi:hypothetical protein